MKKSVVVFGLGRFGTSVALNLSEAGAEVMAVDRDEELIESISQSVDYAAVADLSNSGAIEGLGIGEMDAAVVAIGSDLTASIMCIMVAKEMGIPYVIAKASNERMGLILERIGADKIIYPEKETGARTARMLLAGDFLEFFNVDDNLCIIEMKPKKEWIGKNLKELRLREKHKINVVAIRDKNALRSHIDPDKPLEESTELLVIIDKDDLKKLT